MLTTRELYDNIVLLNKCNNDVGKIEDFIIDFYKARVKGIIIKDYNKRFRYISISYITDDNKNNVEACNMDSIEGMRFSDILNMQVVDKKGIKIGIIEEAILDERYNIKAIVVDNEDMEKEIMLFKDLVLGDNFIMLYSDRSRLTVIEERKKIINGNLKTAY